MGQVLTLRSVAGSGASGGGRIMGAEAGVHNKLAEVWEFAESDRGRFDKEVLGGWIRGVAVEAFSKDPFESGLHRLKWILREGFHMITNCIQCPWR